MPTIRDRRRPRCSKPSTAVHAHLARASFVAARMQLERARAASQALALLGIPALVFADNGKVLAANQLIKNLSGFILLAGRRPDHAAVTRAPIRCCAMPSRQQIGMTPRMCGRFPPAVQTLR